MNTLRSDYVNYFIKKYKCVDLETFEDAGPRPKLDLGRIPKGKMVFGIMSRLLTKLATDAGAQKVLTVPGQSSVFAPAVAERLESEDEKSNRNLVIIEDFRKDREKAFQVAEAVGLETVKLVVCVVELSGDVPYSDAPFPYESLAHLTMEDLTAA